VSALARAQLEAAYRYCRHLNAQHGRTFFLAAALLPPQQRPAVHALYGFARYADDLVDSPVPGVPASERLAALREELNDALDGRQAAHPVVRAVTDTAHRYGIDRTLFDDFLTAMTSDLTVTRYATFADLRRYMWGSASVIGLQLLPVIGTRPGADVATAKQAAADLGIAFQLTNFVRDVSEDYARGRVYLPLDSLEAHRVPVSALGGSVATPAVRALIAAEVARARSFYAAAEPGIDLLAPTAQDCVRAAFVLYGDILGEVERNGFDPLQRRAVVPRWRRARVGLAGYRRALKSRR